MKAYFSLAIAVYANPGLYFPPVDDIQLITDLFRPVNNRRMQIDVRELFAFWLEMRRELDEHLRVIQKVARV